MFTIEYSVNGRTFQHSGNGQSLTRFLSFLNREELEWRYAPTPNGSNLFRSLDGRY